MWSKRGPRFVHAVCESLFRVCHQCVVGHNDSLNLSALRLFNLDFVRTELKKVNQFVVASIQPKVFP